MSTSSNLDRICVAALALAVLIAALAFCAPALGYEATSGGVVLGYEERLFDTSVVHTIDIVMDDWEGFIAGCEDEEYVLCDLVIDGEEQPGAGIRAKGNTSLSSVAAYGNDRYSFKIEFDHYDSSLSYYGLDKLNLNNIIQDNTYMKDFLSYQLMAAAGAAAPLCSYVWITVNGEDWGLYLAVEGVEESFLLRNYGTDYGELYKPDSMEMGGGRGNGGGFDMDQFQERFENDEFSLPEGTDVPGEGEFSPPEGEEMPAEGGFDRGEGGFGGRGGMGGMPSDMGEPPEDMGGMPDMSEMPEMGEIPDMGEVLEMGEMPEMGGGMGGGMMGGSSDVLLVYTDDDYDSYANIFDNAKTDVSNADKDRLIDALQALGEGGDVSDCVDIESVISYFVAHNFVCNFDSYTGSMIHNYYLYEDGGLLSMLPWDYNLAFGGFMGSSDAEALVNWSIDDPTSDGDTESRPMLAWIFESEEYTELYHAAFAEFIESVFTSGEFERLFDETVELISTYVERDPTKFCTYEVFELGAETLREFCLLRAESIGYQLAGEDVTVDASGLDISAMGSMNNTAGGGGKGFRG
jgi:spore coat protein CotH